MSWIKVDSELVTSPKFLNLVARLKVGPRDAYWNLSHFWFWVSAHYQDGVLKDVSDFAIAHSAGWPGEPKAFVDALIEAGFVDREEGQLRVHDWSFWRPEWVRSRDRRVATRKRPENDRDSTSSVQEDVRDVVLSFPVSGGNGKDWHLRQKHLTELSPLYPGIDVALECRKALQWVKDNPSRKKTAKGMPRFLSGWLDRSQNRARGSHAHSNGLDAKTREELDARVDAIIGGRRPVARV